MNESQKIEDLNLKQPAVNASIEAVSKAKDAAEAIEVSRAKQLEEMFDKMEDSNVKTLSDVLKNVFGEFENSGRFIDIKRIPLICAQITKIHDDNERQKADISNINDNLKWAVRIVLGAVIMGLLTLLFKA